MEIKENISLKNYNTFGMDCKSKYFVEIPNFTILSEVLESKIFLQNKALILGGGSNILFTHDFEGIVLKIDFKGIQLIQEDENHVYIRAEAGEVWHHLVEYCVLSNYAGIENLSLIPGSCGAAPIQNIGAYGVELKDVLHEVEVFDVQEKTKKIFKNKECEFGYRDSIFKRVGKGKYVVLGIVLKLNKKPIFHVAYGTIEQELEKMGHPNLTIKAISEAVCNIRRSKLPDPAKIGNAGSFFKNPVISKQHYQLLKEKYADIPCYESGNDVKVPAGWLIEKAGWKGKNKGTYGVHEKQALVLVNYGNAKGQDIYALSEEMILDIQHKYNITLEREVNIY